ncbi:cysteine desulfurase [Candidatus Woesearchaeota archaeon]|nr:cysteine desulfurase [Candidatus Woesearchaeota archaeon]
MMFTFNPEQVRKDFPILKKKIIYLDSACMSLKPQQVIDAMKEYYTDYTACAGRSAHKLAHEVEERVDKSRHTIRKFIGAGKDQEIIFTRNTTEGINLVANTLDFKKGDEVVVSDKEHNSNLIPWLKLKGIVLKFIKTNDDNTLDLDDAKEKITAKTKLVGVVHRSNMDGVTNPIKELAKIAHKNGALMMADGAQSVPGMTVEVKDLDVDFLAFSGHKALGPTGTGVLYGKKALLEKLDQFLVGGETVLNSTYKGYEPEHLPMKFEAGLQNYAGNIALGTAVDYLKKIGMKTIEKHEILLNRILTEELGEKVQLLGPQEPEKRAGIFSFNAGKDPHHISKMLDISKNIMTRSGAHCVHAWFNAHNMKGSVRASMYLYNTEEEMKILAEELKKIIKI